MSKKLEQKQARRLAEERRKAEHRKAAVRRNFVTIAIALVVAAVVVVAIIQERGGQEGGVDKVVGVSPAEANCSEIENPEKQSREHIGVGEEHPPYSSSPPTSGPHYEVPAETRFFSEALPPEQAIHNLEHGAIVIWYSPETDSETLNDIETLTKQVPEATVATAYSDIKAPYQFALSAWGHLQFCEKVSQKVVDDFRTQFQGKGPEKLTPTFPG